MRAFPWWIILILSLGLVALSACANGDDDDNDDAAADDDNDDQSPGDDDDNDDNDDNDNDDNDDNNDDSSPVEPVDYIDPFIGSGGLGYGYASAYPGPKVPFGMLSLCPDTTLDGINYGFNHFSGYYYPDPQIRGFSHTRMHGTGAPDGASLLIMPTDGMPGTPIKERSYRSKYLHTNERAEAGYYRVWLDDPQVLAELTTADLAAMHRYTYAPSDDPYLVVVPTHSIEEGWVQNATVAIDPANRTVSGMMDLHGPMSGRHGGVLVYYVVRFSEPFAAYGTWKDGDPTANQTAETGTDIGAYFRFALDRGSPLLVKTGLSYQSEEQAAANLDDRIPEWDFDGLRAAAKDQWREVVSQIDLVGGTERQKRIFYTALYHAFLMPTDWTEANNRYFGFDQTTHDAGDRRYYTDFSLWDTFRTEHPLLNLLRPAESADLMQSLVDMYDQGGAIPKWPQADGETGSMIGTSADIVFAEAYLKGIRDWDYETAYEGCYTHATVPGISGGRSGLDDYLTLGYVAEDHSSKGTCDTLEYSYDDAALSWWADAMGLTDDAEMFLEHSHNYRNHWDAETEFLRPRNSDGSFYEPFYPGYVFSEQYVEGNAWHWSFYVPHDAAGLIDLFGTEAAFLDKLGYAFEQAVQGPDNAILPDIYFWHGNEMSLFHAYLFNYTSRLDLTQKYVRWILETKHRDEPAGLNGNDDCGTLSSWYLFSSLGFFPLAGSDVYTIGSPLFDGATLHLAGGDLVVSVENNSPENVYVQSVKLNGVALAEPFFTHDQIVDGGTLEFVMGAQPGAWPAKR
ncbi:MAG: glycoside hydrolase family 92 protein [Myxococcales bacterium]|nr:glycoside hydrolase family 92 protein [Myxococcales bacterium]